MRPLLIVSQVMGSIRLASAASEAIEADVSLKVWDVLHATLKWASGLIGRVRPASATSEAIEAEVLLKVWDVLHPRAVGKGGRRAQRVLVGRAKRAYRQRPSSSCRRQRIASCFIICH